MPAIRFSADGAATWTEPVELTAKSGIYYVMNERLIETRRGALVLPVARGGGQYEGDNNVSGCFYSTDGGKTWSQSETWARLDGERGVAEPVVAELADGRLLMLARTGKGSHHLSYSSDGGRAWSPPRPTTLMAACSPLTMKSMPDGRLLVVYDHAAPIRPEAFFPRRPWSGPFRPTAARPGASRSSSTTNQDNNTSIRQSRFLDHGILIVYSSLYASPAGDFSRPDDWWKIGGGKSCIVECPAKR